MQEGGRGKGNTFNVPPSHPQMPLETKPTVVWCHTWGAISNTALLSACSTFYLTGQRWTTKGGFAGNKHRIEHRLASSCLTGLLKGLMARVPSPQPSPSCLDTVFVILFCPPWQWQAIESSRDVKESVCPLWLSGQIQENGWHGVLVNPFVTRNTERVAAKQENNEQLYAVPLPAPCKAPPPRAN